MKGLLGKKWFKRLGILVLSGVLTFGVLLGVVIYGNYDHIQGEPATMIVLGCQIHPWGPSILLQDRLEEALSYLEEHPDMTIIVSGGQGSDEHTSEAACMRDYLLQAGIDEERILVEDRSHNTWQNMICSVELMSEHDLDAQDGVLIVSNGFHLTRARMLWHRVAGEGDGVSTLAAPSSHVPSRIWMYIRESLALAKSFVFDRA